MSAQTISEIDQQRETGELPLKQLVSRFVRAGRRERSGQVPEFQGFDAAFLGILSEIDETMLARQLSVESDRQVVAVLTVSNRRLIAIDSPHLAMHDRKAPASDPKAAASWFVECLNVLFESSKTVSVRVAGRSPSVSGSKLSCSPQMLADAAGISFGAANRDPVPQRDFQALKDMSQAWVSVWKSTKPPESDGSESLIHMLHKLDEARQRSGDRASLFKSGQATCSFLTINASTTLVICEDAAQRFLALIAASDRDLAIDIVGKNTP